MASNKFFFNDGSSSSEESSDDEQQVQVQTIKKSTSKGGAKSYVILFDKTIVQFLISVLLNHILLSAMMKKMLNVLYAVKKLNGISINIMCR